MVSVRVNNLGYSRFLELVKLGMFFNVVPMVGCKNMLKSLAAFPPNQSVLCYHPIPHRQGFQFFQLFFSKTVHLCVFFCDWYSTSGTGAALVALVVAVLAAIAEVLAPGVRGVAGVHCIGPIPVPIKGGFAIGVKQCGLLKRR